MNIAAIPNSSMRDRDITVVKLGGSLAGSVHLAGWLDALSTCGGVAVIVPGGGPFADAVRAAQSKMGFDDAAAHAMALLAMQQFGLALANLRPGFRAAGSTAAIRGVLREGKVPEWAPAAMVLRASDIPPSWDVTSDSLAAWLAGRFGARRLVLVKHGAPDSAVSAADLATRGAVDPAFPRFLEASGAQAFIVPPEAHAAAGAAIPAGGTPGVPIDLPAPDTKGLHSSPWPRSRHRAGAGP
jgi:dihydroneopterin aldolase